MRSRGLIESTPRPRRSLKLCFSPGNLSIPRFGVGHLGGVRFGDLPWILFRGAIAESQIPPALGAELHALGNGSCVFGIPFECAVRWRSELARAGCYLSLVAFQPPRVNILATKHTEFGQGTVRETGVDLFAVGAGLATLPRFLPLPSFPPPYFDWLIVYYKAVRQSTG